MLEHCQTVPAHLFCLSRLFEQISYGQCEFAAIGNDLARSDLNKVFGDFLSVEKMRPGNDGQTLSRRLEQVVATNRYETSANERNIARRIEKRNFAIVSTRKTSVDDSAA